VYISKFDFNKSKWSSFILEIPKNLINYNIQTILTCAGKLYAIVSCYDIQKHGQVGQQWITCLMELKEDVSKFGIKQCLFQGNESTNVLACTVQDKKICILANSIGMNPNARRKSTKFVVFDTATNTIFDQIEGAQWGTLMIPVGDEIVVTEMGNSSCTKYSFAMRKWRHTKEQFLPFPKHSPENTEYSSVSDGNNFYLFVKHTQSLESPTETWCYNFSEKKWKNLQALPQPLRQSATCLVQLPSNLSKCHIDCPHCRFSCIEKATYDIHDLTEMLEIKKVIGSLQLP
jgi:hypothetical protein